MRNSKRYCATCWLAAIFFLGAASAWACDIPVYEYALDQWEADPYEVIVYHRGPLAPEHQAVLDTLEPDRDQASADVSGAVPNLSVRAADLSGALDALTQGVWEAQASPELPWMVVRYPFSPPQRKPVWTGALTAAHAALIADSPKRGEAVKRLLAGDMAVWVFLEIGDPDKDEAALRRLQDALAAIDELKPATAAYRQRPSGTADSEERRFSVLRVSRNDPAEQALVAMLLGSESDLLDYEEPMAFPVFGRGRALYALVGAGIEADNVRDAAMFLATACTCIVKQQNPGTDILMTADWTSWRDDRPILQITPLEPPEALAATIEDDLDKASSPHVLRLVVVALALSFVAVLAFTVLLARRNR